MLSAVDSACHLVCLSYVEPFLLAMDLDTQTTSVHLSCKRVNKSSGLLNTPDFSNSV